MPLENTDNPNPCSDKEIADRLENWQPVLEQEMMNYLEEQLSAIPEDILGKSTADFTEPLNTYLNAMRRRHEALFKLSELCAELNGYLQQGACSGTITVDTANIRLRPTTDSDVIGRTSGAVTILGQVETGATDYNIWYLLDSGGWVAASLVTVDDCVPQDLGDDPIDVLLDTIGINEIKGDYDQAELEEIVFFLRERSLVLLQQNEAWTIGQLRDIRFTIIEIEKTYNVSITGEDWPLEVVLATPEILKNIQDLSDATFQGNWTRQDFEEIPVIIKDLETYGVTLGSTSWEEEYGITLDIGSWKPEEIRLIYDGVLSTASRVHQQFGVNRRPGAQDLAWWDERASFLSLYGELNITRGYGDFAREGPGWFGWSQGVLRNIDAEGVVSYPEVMDAEGNITNPIIEIFGLRIVLGGKALRQDNARYYLDYENASPLGYRPIDLVTHEINHRINYRASDPNDQLALCLGAPSNLTAIESIYRSEPCVIYTESGELEEVSCNGNYDERLNRDKGYTSAARSSNVREELVTDAFMNWSLGNFTDDRYGRFRRRQLNALMNQIIRCLSQNER